MRVGILIAVYAAFCFWIAAETKSFLVLASSIAAYLIACFQLFLEPDDDTHWDTLL